MLSHRIRRVLRIYFGFLFAITGATWIYVWAADTFKEMRGDAGFFGMVGCLLLPLGLTMLVTLFRPFKISA